MASFFIPLTGLEADSTAMNTIANNLANLNTVGYKAQTANFSDLFYQEIGSSGSGDPILAGGGTKIASVETDYSQGSADTTDDNSNVALDGNGFFLVSDGGVNMLTRNGDFTLDSSGNLVTSNGLSVMGYPATDGTVNTNAAITAIHIPVDQVMSPQASTEFSQTATLDASSAVGTTFSAPVTLYDSLGESHTATITYTKTDTNTWSYSMTMADTLSASSSTATDGTSTTSFTLGSGATIDSTTDLTITGETSSGGTATITAPTITSGESQADYATALTSALSAAGITGVTVTQTGNTISISGTNFSTSGSLVQDAVGSSNTSGTLTFDTSGNLATPASDVSDITFSGLADGASTMTTKWELYDSTGSGAISQVDATSAVSATYTDGYASGEYEDFTVDSSGVVSVEYTNGETQDVGQLAIGNVVNLQGLQAVGNGDYEATTASGNISIGTAGAGGLGTIEDDNVEESNVNISTEFSALIIAQRAFEANSKAVTTFDTVAEDTIGMIR